MYGRDGCRNKYFGSISRMVMLYSNYFTDVLRNAPPQKQLLEFGGTPYTAEELYASSVSLAVRLQKLGLKRGDRVVLIVRPDVDFLRIMYANMMIRTMVSIIDPEMGRDNFRAKFEQFKPQFAFIDSRLLLLKEHPIARWIAHKLRPGIPDLPGLGSCKVVSVGPWMPLVRKYFSYRKLISAPPVREDLASTDDQEEFLVTYTSGTLSEPKGVVHTFRSISTSIQHLSDLLAKSKNESIATHLPAFILLGISAGVKAFIWNPNWSPEKKWEFIEANGVTTLFGPPSDYLDLIRLAENTDQPLPRCLKSIYLGSAPVYTAFLKIFLKRCEHITVTCLYGMTENLMVAYADARKKLEFHSEGDWVGKLFPGVEIEIGEDGEIFLNSDQIFSRYYHTESRISPHPTGDIGTLVNDNEIVLQGRKKDMIIRRNLNIYPGLYEPTINRISGIYEAVLIGVYNAVKADEDLVLVVEGDSGLDAQKLLKKLKTGTYSIDQEAIPDRVVFMKLSRSGRQNKVNRRFLREYLKERGL